MRGTKRKNKSRFFFALQVPGLPLRTKFNPLIHPPNASLLPSIHLRPRQGPLLRFLPPPPPPQSDQFLPTHSRTPLKSHHLQTRSKRAAPITVPLLFHAPPLPKNEKHLQTKGKCVIILPFHHPPPPPPRFRNIQAPQKIQQMKRINPEIALLPLRRGHPRNHVVMTASRHHNHHLLRRRSLHPGGLFRLTRIRCCPRKNQIMHHQSHADCLQRP